ncbi:hypothetical protein RvY_07356 [Ramazzottius varieornatus]|uniref:G-protein coupled receptors family 1 profile domain-containing protein n=1 Tax=Ramazzottius varieornatus TaxID=947166 RepID=A0A1D1V219_RAMVA|nr:hypothetical protein RvY_07356 [Ramazzottius varieornatus]
MDTNAGREDMTFFSSTTSKKSLTLNVANDSGDPMENVDGFGQEFIYGLGFVYCLICVVGLAGNTLVFYVVCRFSSMHTVTNVYILALSLADIAFLVNVPFLVATSVLGDWPFGDVYCKMYV